MRQRARRATHHAFADGSIVRIFLKDPAMAGEAEAVLVSHSSTYPAAVTAILLRGSPGLTSLGVFAMCIESTEVCRRNENVSCRTIKSRSAWSSTSRCHSNSIAVLLRSKSSHIAVCLGASSLLPAPRTAVASLSDDDLQ